MKKERKTAFSSSFPIFADYSHRGADQEEQGAEAGRAGKEI